MTNYGTCAILETLQQQGHKMSQKTIRVFLVLDPSTYVDVKTTEANVRSKLHNIRRDIWAQKFPRWAPFDHLTQATTDG